MTRSLFAALILTACSAPANPSTSPAVPADVPASPTSQTATADAHGCTMVVAVTGMT